MLFHLIETGRHRMWHFGSTFWSAGAHAAAVATIVVGAMPAPDDASSHVDHETVYLLPALPSAPSRPTDGQLAFRGEADAPHARTGPGAAGAARGKPDATRGADPVRSPIVPVVLDSTVRTGSAVFVAADLDRLVERDPASAAPEYPLDLERQQVEGAVSAEWVVDSTGRADPATFRILAATNPGFVDAVRSALPGMRFRPAELFGRHVSQLVRQEFTFRIRLAVADSAPVPR